MLLHFTNELTLKTKKVSHKQHLNGVLNYIKCVTAVTKWDHSIKIKTKFLLDKAKCNQYLVLLSIIFFELKNESYKGETYFNESWKETLKVIEQKKIEIISKMATLLRPSTYCCPIQAFSSPSQEYNNHWQIIHFERYLLLNPLYCSL